MVKYFMIKPMSFHQKLESIQFNTCLALVGTICGTSKGKFYQELGLESLHLRRWYKKLRVFYKIRKSKSPQYLFTLIPEIISSHVTKNADNIPLFNIKHNFIIVLYFRWSSFFRTTQALAPGVQKILVFSKIIFWNLLSTKQKVFLTAAFLRGLEWSNNFA